MKRLSAAVAALLLGVTLGACSSSGSDDQKSSSSGDYCAVLKRSQDSFGALGFDRLTDEQFAKSRESISQLQQAASGPIADDWSTLGTGLDGLKKAVEDAGVSLSDIPQLVTGNAPNGLDPAQAQQLVGELQKFAANPELSKAANEIQTDAKQTCNVDLQGAPSS